MITVSVVLLIVALVCFVLATFQVASRINLMALGLCFVVAAKMADFHGVLG